MRTLLKSGMLISLILAGSPALALDTPSNFVIIDCSSMTLTWSWDDVAGEDGYQLLDNPTGNIVVDFIGQNITSINESGLTPNTTYTRKIRAYNDVAQLENCNAIWSGEVYNPGSWTRISNTIRLGNDTEMRYGAAKFGLDNLSGVTSVSDVKIYCRCAIANPETGARLDLTELSTDPQSGDMAAVANEIDNGAIFLDDLSDHQSSGYKIFDLPSSCNIWVQNNLATGWVAIGFDEDNKSTTLYAAFNGYLQSPAEYRPVLEVSYFNRSFSGNSSIVSACTLAAVPYMANTAVTFTLTNTDTITIHAGENGNPSGTTVELFYAPDSGGSPGVWVSQGTLTSGYNWNITGLTSETTHWFKAKAQNWVGIWTQNSSLVCWSTAPDAPANFTNIGCSTNTLTWAWDSNGGSGFDIFDNGSGAAAVVDIASEATYTIETGLSPNTTYARHLVAYIGGSSQAENCSATYSGYLVGTSKYPDTYIGMYYGSQLSEYQGFCKFGLDNLSTGITVLDARLFCYCYNCGPPDSAIFDIRKLTSDPVSASAATITSEISSGEVFIDNSAENRVTGHKVFTLNAQSHPWIESYIAGGWCAAGFKEENYTFNTDGSFFSSWNNATSSQRPRLQVTWAIRTHSTKSEAVEACTLAAVPTMDNTSATFYDVALDSMKVHVGECGNPPGTMIDLLYARGNAIEPTESFSSAGIKTSGYEWELGELDISTTYWFKAYAKNWAGIWSDNCAITSASTLRPPSDFECVESSSITVTWKWTSNGGYGFDIFDNDTHTKVVENIAFDATNTVETGLNPNTTYTRYIKAFTTDLASDNCSALYSCSAYDTPVSNKTAGVMVAGIWWPDAAKPLVAGFVKFDLSGFSAGTYVSNVRLFVNCFDNISYMNTDIRGIGIDPETATWSDLLDELVNNSCIFLYNDSDIGKVGGYRVQDLWPDAEDWVENSIDSGTDCCSLGLLDEDVTNAYEQFYGWDAGTPEMRPILEITHGSGVKSYTSPSNVVEICTPAAVPCMTNTASTFPFANENTITVQVGENDNPSGTAIELFSADNPAGPFVTRGIYTSGYLWNITGLDAITSYYFKARARNWSGSWTDNCAATYCITPPAAPGNFRCTDCSSSTLTWEWNDVTSEEGYDIFDNDSGILVIAGISENAASTMETGLTPNTSYRRHIKAYIETGSGSTSYTNCNALYSCRAYGAPLNLKNDGNWRAGIWSDSSLIGGFVKFDVSGLTAGTDITNVKLYAYCSVDDNTIRIEIKKIGIDPETANYSDLMDELSSGSVYLYENSLLCDVPADYKMETLYSAAASLWVESAVNSGTGCCSLGIIDEELGTNRYCIFTEWDCTNVDMRPVLEVEWYDAGKEYSASSDVAEFCTLIPNPGDSDLSLVDTVNGIIEVEVTSPPNGSVGQTGVYIEHDNSGDWAGVDYAIIGGGWTQTYSHNDTVPYNGTWYYRIQFRNQIGAITTFHVKTVKVNSIPPDAPTGFYGDNVWNDSITWHWTDNSQEEACFELHNSADMVVAEAGADNESVVESGLLENTVYSRHVHACGIQSIPETMDQFQETASISEYYNYSSYRRAQTFIPSMGGNLVKLEFYGRKYGSSSYDLEISIYPTVSDKPDMSGAALASETITLDLTAQWRTIIFTSPAWLNSGTKYSIVFNTPGATSVTYANYIYYYSASSYAEGDRCYSSDSGTSWSISSSGYDYAFRTYMAAPSGLHSSASNTNSACTLIHDPGDADLSLEDTVDGIVEVAVSSPPNSSVGQTGVYIERDNSGDWAGPDYSVVGGGWTQSFIQYDTVPYNGTWYYRIRLRNQEGEATLSHTEYLDVNSVVPIAPSGFYGDNASIDSITWHWTDNSPDETGFEVHSPADTKMAETAAGNTSVLETGLSENTAYSRHVHSFVGTMSPEQDALTYPGSFTTGSNYYTMGFRFTPNTDMTITKVRTYSGSYKATIWTDGGLVLRTIDPAAGDEGWPSFDVSPPLDLTCGETYRIGVYVNPYKYTTMSNVTPTSDITVHCSLYLAGDTFPTTENTVTMYGVVNFVYQTLSGKLNSNPSNTDTFATLVHEPLADDFSLEAISGYMVKVTVTPPPNSTYGNTGCYIERSDDGGSIWNPVSGWIQNYIYEDSGLLPDTEYLYRLKYRNIDGNATDVSPSKAVTTLGAPPSAPSAFYGDTITNSSITWHWTDNSGDEDGFEVQDEANSMMAETGAGITAVIESGLEENSLCERHCHAYKPGSGSLENITIGSGTTSQRYPIDIYYNYARCQMLYLQSEINKVGTINKIRFYQNDTDSVTINNCAIYMDETTDTTLSAWVGGDNGPGTMVFSGNLTSAAVPGWYEITLDTPFAYSNTENLIVSFRHQDGTYVSNYPGWNTSSITNRCLAGQSDTVNPPTAVLVSYLPNVQFEIDSSTRNYSNPSNSNTKCTLVNEPVDADLALADIGSGQVQITVAPPPNQNAGQTSAYIERDAEGDWTGTDYAVISGDWTQTYTQIDYLPVNGTWYYRIRLRNQTGATTSTHFESLDVTSAPPIAPTVFTGIANSTTGIEWSWNDNSQNEDGFEIQNSSDLMVLEIGSDNTSAIESGLAENVVYQRHCHAFIGGEGSGVTYSNIYPSGATPGGNSSEYGLVSNGEALSNLENEGDSLYWSCDRQDFPAIDPQEIWTDFSFDISTTGLTGPDIANFSFTCKVYFTGALSTVPINDSMEFDYIDEAKIQLYNFNASTWENLGGNFFTTMRPSLWRDSVEANLWDFTTDVNPDSPIIRVKDSGWSGDYVNSGIIKTRVFIKGGFTAGSWDAMWVFDHVKIDVTEEVSLKNYSDPSNNCSVYTHVHGPLDSDLNVTASTPFAVNLTVTPPPNSTAGQTGCHVERSDDGGSIWNTVYDWSQIYNRVNSGLIPDTTYQYRFTYRNGDGNITDVSPVKTVVTPNDPPPGAPSNLWVNNFVNPDSLGNSTIFLTAVYNDSGAAIDAVEAWIQLDNDSDFSSPNEDTGWFAITPTTRGSRCSPIVYDASGLSKGQTYYWQIKFRNQSAQETPWSIESAYFLLAEYTHELPSKSYHLLNIPCYTGGAKIGDMLIDDLGMIWAFKYDEAQRIWIQVTGSNVFENNVGYFFWCNQPGNVAGFRGNSVSEEAASFTVPLTCSNDSDLYNYGWNLIRNPYSVDISWSSCDLQNCEATHWYPWTGTEYKLYDKYSGGCGSDTIPAGASFWVHANGSNAQITIYRPGGAPPPLIPPALNWKIRLVAQSGQLTDTQTYIGAREGALTGHDQFDIMKIDSFATDYIQTYFDHPEWGRYAGKYTLEMLPFPAVGGMLNWNIRVYTTNADGMVNLKWSISDELHGGWCFYLRDHSTGMMVNMLTFPNYGYSASGEDSRQFTLSAARLRAFVLGDADLNGIVTEGDAAYCARTEHEIEPLTAEQRYVSDLNSDGKVDILDSLLILRRLRGHLPSNP